MKKRTRQYKSCTVCGMADSRYEAKGMCARCYMRQRRDEKYSAKDYVGNLEMRERGLWSRKYESCIGCGGTEKRHGCFGLCHDCSEISRKHKLRFGGNRQLVIDRDEGRCQDCGTDSNIVVHHVDGDRKNNRMENLLTLCTACHGRLHREEQLTKA